MHVINSIVADCKHHAVPTWPDSLVVVGTKQESDVSVEWHQGASSSSVMLVSSRMRQSCYDCSILKLLLVTEADTVQIASEEVTLTRGGLHWTPLSSGLAVAW